MTNQTDRPKSSFSKPIPPFIARGEKYDRVRVGSTGVRGLGVFALVDIKGGRAVGRVKGELKPKDYRSCYCIDFGDGTLEPFEPYRFLNHSCDPNCQLIEWQIELDSDKPILELWVHTLRDIKADEELTIDYAWEWRFAVPCLCGSENCRGWICKAEELDKCVKFHSNLDCSRDNSTDSTE